jgi:hypothetical protein
MWPLAGARPDEFPASKAEDALLMLTDYAADPACDRKLIDILVRKYRRVFFWPQGKYDLRDIQALGAPVTILDRSFAALNEFLATGPPVDYVGTRLHGGIHCLNHRKRSLILEVDNRAREISRDTGLLVVPRDDFGAIERWIDHGRSFHLHLNEAAIAEWKAQFIAPKRHKKSSEPGPNP